MSTPSKARNLDGEYTQTSPAANRQVGSKQFLLRHDILSAILTSGVSGMKRKKLLVRSESADGVIVFLGPQGVTKDDGFPLYPGDEIELDVDEGATVKAVHDIPSPSGETATVYILELE